MSNKWTFTIKPIKGLLEKYKAQGLFKEGRWIDPFAGKYSSADLTNDLNPEMPTDFHLEALEFLKMQPDNSFDGGLFDPPYSPRQVKEVYDGIGISLTSEQTKMSFWSDIKNEIARVLKLGGVCICFGWSSMGLGKSRGFEMQEILLVPHGGSKNDTIVTVERKL